MAEPFSRIALDLVGPLLRSRSGNKYLLVLCDYATRYQEAVPLKSIDAESVAEELIKVFARVGVPLEILTNQAGTNFASQLLAELYRLLQVRPIRTSPYHPETDGLVERFNQTLKLEGCDRHREGPGYDDPLPRVCLQGGATSVKGGFSVPVALWTGWESGTASDENVISYVMSTREKLSQMAEVVKET